MPDYFGGNDRRIGRRVDLGDGRSAYVAAVTFVDADGNPTSGGGGTGGGGDASAANQTTQITRETEIRDRIGAVTSPAAGSTNQLLTAVLARLVTNGGLGLGTDRSGSITAANTGQQVAPANTTRRAMAIQNTSSGDLFVNEVGGSAGAAGSAGTYTLPAGATFTVKTTNAVSIRGATVGQTYTATESA